MKVLDKPAADLAPVRKSLFGLAIAAQSASRRISDDLGGVAIDSLREGCSIAGGVEALRGRCVLIVCDRQLPAVLATIALDGIARRILLCPPDIDPTHLSAISAEAEVDAVVTDGTGPDLSAIGAIPLIACGRDVIAGPTDLRRDVDTGWVLFTSGTTGRPKLVLHSLSSLSGPLDDGLAVASGAVWSTFYDVRRYGGLQILLRALIGGGSMVLSSRVEPVGDFLKRAGASGVTHISGTPSHWRRALMSPQADQMAPDYVRLSGEVADQAILDHLNLAYPHASVAHAFASTEAGVAFDVRDGLAGFPASYLDPAPGRPEMRIEAGTLRIRSSRIASCYLGGQKVMADAEGYIDTGDIVELHAGRLYFMGRREGVINVGGLKVHPEEVEAVINRHPGVRMSRVWARRSPITGAIVAAEIVLADPEAGGFEALRDAIIAECRQALAAHKVPVTLRAVVSLPINAAGKLRRVDA